MMVKSSKSEPESVVEWGIGFKPGNTLRNVGVATLYILFWPLGILLAMFGVLQNWRSVGTVGRALTLSGLGVALLFVIALATVGPSGEPETITPEDHVNQWMDDHQTREKAALSAYQEGGEFWEEERYFAAMNSYTEAAETYGELQWAARDEANQYEVGTRGHKLFSLLVTHYGELESHAEWRAQAAREMGNGERGEAELSLAASLDPLRNANQAKDELRKEMGWD